MKNDMEKYNKLLEKDEYISEKEIDPELLEQLVDAGLLEEVGSIDEEESSIKDKMDLLSLKEEEERREIQANPTSIVTETTRESDLYEKAMIKTETIGAMFQSLIGFGVDYNNAISIALNVLKDEQELKLAQLSTMI